MPYSIGVKKPCYRVFSSIIEKQSDAWLKLFNPRINHEIEMASLINHNY
jgi:hypothetical protein